MKLKKRYAIFYYNKGYYNDAGFTPKGFTPSEIA
jgi:hypothetical protein